MIALFTVAFSSFSSNAIFSGVEKWGEDWQSAIPEDEVLRLYEESYKLHYAVSVNPTHYIDIDAEGVYLDYQDTQIVYKPAKGQYSNPDFWREWANSIYTDEFAEGAILGCDTDFSSKSFYREIDGKVYFAEDISDLSLFDENCVKLKKEDYLYANADRDECYYGAVVQTIKGDTSSLAYDGELSKNNNGTKFPIIADIDSNIKDVIYAEKSDCTGNFIFWFQRNNGARRFYSVSFIKEGENWKINGGEILNWYASGASAVSEYLNSADKVLWERTLNSQVAKIKLEEKLSEEYGKDVVIDRLVCWYDAILADADRTEVYAFLYSSKDINNGQITSIATEYNPATKEFANVGPSNNYLPGVTPVVYNPNSSDNTMIIYAFASFAITCAMVVSIWKKKAIPKNSI